MTDTVSTRPKLLWIGKARSTGSSGEVIYDRTLSAELESHFDISHLEPSRVAAWQEVLNLLLLTPYYRAKFKSAANRDAVRNAASMADIVICSWEPFDFALTEIDRPTVVIWHNVTSAALRSMFPRNLVFRLLAWIAERYERSVVDRVEAMVVLSKSDRTLVGSFGSSRRVEWLPPGGPPSVGLAPNAVLEESLVLSGSYDWSVKRRDLLAFFDEIDGRQCFRIQSDDLLPSGAASRFDVKAAHLDDVGLTQGRMRFGLITDRFVAGHKLKASAFVANNCIALSYADISEDFAGLPDAGLFIRRISNADDIVEVFREFRAIPIAGLIQRFVAFKSACAAAFDWQVAGCSLQQIARQVLDESAG